MGNPLENLIVLWTFICYSLGAIADLDLAIRSKKISDDIMVVRGGIPSNMLLNPATIE